jgi:hypothetical protein
MTDKRNNNNDNNNDSFSLNFIKIPDLSRNE